MNFIPEEELKGIDRLSLAPMVDFLFLMLMFFATLAVSRATTKDTDLSLVEIKPETTCASITGDCHSKTIHININNKGEYKWVTEIHDYPLASAAELAGELLSQYEKGLLPEDKSKTYVMLKIDKDATWEPILKAIFAIRDAGFDAKPAYEPEEIHAKS